MAKLHMLTAFLQRYAQANPKNVDWKMGEEYMFELWDEDVLSVRMGDESYEYAWLSTQKWLPLESVSELKYLLA